MTKFTLSLLLLSLLLAVSAFAGARRFTYIYEATTAAPGGFELENWITWQSQKIADNEFQEVDFRHEIEFGITDQLQAGVYLADWFYQSGRFVESSGFAYSDSALELIYNLSSPVADPVGLAVYEEIKAGDRLFELESKLIAQKNFGKLVVAYNATLEAVWEGNHLDEREGEFQQTLGASYEFTPRLLAGAEFLHEIAFPDWLQAEDGVVFGGPNISYRIGRWWTTLTGLAQLTRNRNESDFQVRTIFGCTF
ncbi:MAG: DUF6662 family protein [Verrucomicrobiota bacterium]